MQKPLRAFTLAAISGLAAFTVESAAQQLTGVDLGFPSVPGSITTTNNASGKLVHVIVGGGSDIWNSSDNCYYAYMQVTNDFDYVVKVASHVGNSGDGGWSKAELMVRLDDGSGAPQGSDPFLANMATRPASDTANGAPAGVNHRGPQWRAQRDSACSWTQPSPEYPPNADHNWLRLERVGNVFYMYTSDDGKAWNMYNPYSPQGWDTSGSWPAGTDNSSVSVFTNPWPSTILLGLAVTAHNDLDSSTVVFSDFGLYTPVPVAVTTAPPATVSVAQNDPLTLTVAAIGDPVHYQWLKDGSPIAKAVSSTYRIDLVQPADAGKYAVRVYGGAKSITNETVVTVTVDTVPPTVLKASTDVTFTSVTIKYSEPVSDTALSASNYTFDQGLTVSSVTRVDSQTVTLTTTKMAEGGTYHLTIKGVQDKASPANTIAANTTVQLRTLVYVAGVAAHQKYNNVDNNTGSNPSGLFNDPRYPGAPDRAELLKAFEYPANGSGRDSAADPVRNYFDTIDGFFIPPTSGDYVFFISFADRCWMYLSTDENPANKHMIIGLSGWSDPRNWLTSHDYDTTQNRSDSASNTEWPNGNVITLEAGKKYYVQMVHHDPGWAGGDWFSATYKLAADTDPANGTAPLLTGQVIGTFVDPSGISLAITQQPASAAVLENMTATFNVAINSSWSAPAFQWQKAAPGGAFADIANATQSSYTTAPLLLADSGTRYRVNVSVPGTTTASSEATVTVSSDKVPPTLVSVARSFTDETKVTVLFSELVDPATANTVANYKINNGINVTAAILGADGQSVVLTTSAIPKGSTNTLTVTNVKDKAGNLIAAGSQVQLGFQRGVLFIVNSGDPPIINISDGIIKSRLESQGYYVETRGADVDDVSMATGKDLVVASSTISSGNVTDTYKTVAVPVLLWENAIQDDMAMTTVGGSSDRGTTGGQTQIDIVNPSHPMAAGLPAGPVTVVTAAAEFVWGRPNTNAQVVARLVGTANATIYGYDKGAILQDGTAAAERRVTFLMTDNVAAVMNDTGFKLFDAAVNWAQHIAAAQAPPQITSISVKDGNLTIQWSNGGTLKSTTSLAAPMTWTDEAGNGSYTGPTTGPAKFFRVVR